MLLRSVTSKATFFQPAQRVRQRPQEENAMSMKQNILTAFLCGSALMFGSMSTQAQDAQKPNILFIMGDDIGYMQPSIYHRGLMVGETPNIDRIGEEGAMFTSYYAEQSCTA